MLTVNFILIIRILPCELSIKKTWLSIFALNYYSCRFFLLLLLFSLSNSFALFVHVIAHTMLKICFFLHFWNGIHCQLNCCSVIIGRSRISVEPKYTRNTTSANDSRRLEGKKCEVRFVKWFFLQFSIRQNECVCLRLNGFCFCSRLNDNFHLIFSLLTHLIFSMNFSRYF